MDLDINSEIKEKNKILLVLFILKYFKNKLQIKIIF